MQLTSCAKKKKMAFSRGDTFWELFFVIIQKGNKGEKKMHRIVRTNQKHTFGW